MATALPDRLTLDRVATPIGEALLVCDDCGRLRALDWQEHEPRMWWLLRQHYGPAAALQSGRAPSAVTHALAAYFAGDLARLDGIDCATVARRSSARCGRPFGTSPPVVR